MFVGDGANDELAGARRVGMRAVCVLPPGRDDFPVYTGDLYPAQLDRLFVLTTTLLVRRPTAGSALHFPEDLPYSEDWECFARLARAGPAARLQRSRIPRRII